MFENYFLITQFDASCFCIEEHRKRESEKLQILQEELEFLEAGNTGSLKWRKRNGKVYFWEYCNGRQKGISQNEKLVYSLARRDFLRLRLADMKTKDSSKRANDINDLLEAYASAGLDIMKIILTEKQYDWASDPQSQKKNRREDLCYRTDRGVFVRSKSEQFIGSLLEKHGIPYRYEPEIRINGRTIYPDFVIMAVDGRLLILEHLGRMELREYASSAIDRIAAYNKQGLLLGRDVFLSFESDVRSSERVMAIIRQMMAA